jgi:thiamine transporter ThiT
MNTIYFISGIILTLIVICLLFKKFLKDFYDKLD